MISNIIGFTVFLIICVLIHIWNKQYNELCEYRNKEKDNYIFSIKRKNALFGQRFITGEKITKFLNDYDVDELWFNEWIVQRGISECMEQYRSEHSTLNQDPEGEK